MALQAEFAADTRYALRGFKRTPGLDRQGPSLYGPGWFYRGKDSFHLFNTCNRWTAKALEAGTCQR